MGINDVIKTFDEREKFIYQRIYTFIILVMMDGTNTLAGITTKSKPYIGLG